MEDQTAAGPGFEKSRENNALYCRCCGKGAVLLAVGLGFQVLGRYIKAEDGTVIPGAGVFDAYTEAGSDRSVGIYCWRQQLIFRMS